MSFITPVVSALLQASSFTLDKVIMSAKKVTYKNYIGLSFPLIFIINLIIFLIFRPELSPRLFAGKFLFLVILSISLSIIINLIFYKALKSEKLNEIEMISLLGSIPVIILTSFIFESERNFMIIILALISSSAIIWSHWRKDHFQIAKKTWAYLLATLIISPIGAITSKILLAEWNPMSLELVRSFFLAVIFSMFFFKSIEKTGAKTFLLLVITNILTTIAWILYYFSYKTNGVIETVLIFSLQPMLVYLASFILLKEKFHMKKFIAFVIVLASITLSQIL
ncbi:DMT family transporter [Candidatus Pacearchaeota archaeon]|nr:DMT family transporter [Candidatus Pacearchaeota archaeon]